MPNVYSFAPGKSEGHDLVQPSMRKRVLGGKGAGLAEMAAVGLPVPPGFTLACDTSLQWLRDGALPSAVEEEAARALALLEERMGRRLGDPDDPLLVSVRSGSPASMPGMMDTVLNLGLTRAATEGLARRTGDERFAWDAYRRFLGSFGTLVLGLSREDFEEALVAIKRRRRAQTDQDLDARALKEEVVPEFEKRIARSGSRVPEDPREQLRMAREAVFRSWNNPRAIEYRRRFDIPDDLGTAVTVQAMVFGNRGDRSASGVGFTRSPATGEHQVFGEFLFNAQGEDVVAGVRTPMRLEDLEERMPEVARELREHTARLERTYRWPQDFEFTIEDGHLYLLQTRDAKSTALAAVRWAIDFLDAGLLTEEEALLRVDPAALEQLLHPVFDPKALAKASPVTRGLPAGPGAACGKAVFTAAEAVARAAKGEKVILVRRETSADDVAGMFAAQGVLTATGGMTSHAAVVGRQMGRPCVVGAGALSVREHDRLFRVGNREVREGQEISIDGSTGEVYLQALPTAPSEVIRGVTGKLKASDSQLLRDYLKLMELADAKARLTVRTNADRAEDARLAFHLGARGIGLCRTEHMFFGEDRLPIVQRMILAAPMAREGLGRLEALRHGNGNGRARKAERQRLQEQYGGAIDAYLGALSELLPLQRKDFYQLLRSMEGRPVTIRTLDPPLHEFLPSHDELVTARESLLAGRVPRGWDRLRRQLQALGPYLVSSKRPTRLELVEAVLRRVEELHEQNPMLGHRGCRLGISHPEITAMQARALFEAAARCLKEGHPVHVEVMIPLVGEVRELAAQKQLIEQVREEVAGKKGVDIPVAIGTMIEVPRAALTADEIAREAEFFSFGTNDLTQMTFGYSRDDAGRFVPEYLEKKILPYDPFTRLDASGVGKLIRLALAGGRAVRSGLEAGICGEHGGDPASVELAHQLGLDYVSCSPLRVPVARLAAARAAIRMREVEREQEQKIATLHNGSPPRVMQA